MNQPVDISITAAAVAAATSEYGAYAAHGLRILDTLPEDGEILEASRRWIDGEPTDEMYEGTSVIDVRASDLATLAGTYVGRYVVLCGADLLLYGEDPSELLLRGAQVLAAWDRTTGERLY